MSRAGHPQVSACWWSSPVASHQRRGRAPYRFRCASHCQIKFHLEKALKPAPSNDTKVGALKSGKGHAVLLTWEVDGGKYSGRLIFDRIIVMHESAEAMKFGRRKFKDVTGLVSRRRAVQ